MKNYEKYFGFVRIDKKWYYVGKVCGLEDCFHELDRRYSSFMKTGDSFFWIEEDGELHDESGDQQIGYGYFDGREVVTAEQFAEEIGRVVFGHEGIEAVPVDKLEYNHLDLMDESKEATKSQVFEAALASKNFEWIWRNDEGAKMINFFEDAEVSAENKAEALIELACAYYTDCDSWDFLDNGLNLSEQELDEEALVNRGLGWLLACAERMTARDLPEVRDAVDLLPYITDEVLSICRFELRMIFEAEADKLGFDYESQEDEGFSLLGEDLTNLTSAIQYLENLKTRAEVVSLAREFILENIANSSNE